MEEFRHLTEKYREDIVKMKSAERTLDDKVVEKDMEIQDCIQALRDKDTWMDTERLGMKETEAEILVYQSKEDEQKRIKNTLEKKWLALESTIEVCTK